jgi:hypothetical protein
MQAKVEASPFERLLHRWFVEYNPLYVLSAALVLGGMILLSRGLAHDESVYGGLAVAAIAELYAAALIGGAALLVRLGHRRSAVMLGLLTALYQCDLTLHTETSPNLGWIALPATAAWLALFVAKLHALGWALRLRLSRWTVATATLGAAGLALFPYWLSRMDARAASALVTVFAFALATTHRFASVTSLVELDDWGRTVLRRSLRAVWLLWSLLLGLHVVFWSTQYRLDLASLAPVAPFVLLRWTRSERALWLAATGTLVSVALALPSSFAVTAFVAAATFALRAFFGPWPTEAGTASAPVTVAPYRAAAGAPVAAAAPASVAVPIDRTAATRRLLVGASFAIHLAIWTCAWTGGPWPAHVLPLDVVLAAAALVAVWRARARIAIAPLAAVLAHFVVQARIVTAPASLLGWGATSIGVGFTLLAVSLAASYALRARPRAGGQVGGTS